MLKTEKQQRMMVAFIFYLIAIALAIVEFFIQGGNFNFSILIIQPVPYFIYYTLLSKAIDENTPFPLVGVIVLAIIIYNGTDYSYNFICELLEVLLFIIQIITAFVAKFIRVELKARMNKKYKGAIKHEQCD